MRFLYPVAACALLAGSALQPLAAQDFLGRPEPLRKVGIDQNLNHQLPLYSAFVDDAGKPVRLGDYFQNRPVVLAFVYYRCPMLCNLVLDGMIASLKQIELKPGADYQVVAISIDDRETAELAAAKKRTYLKHFPAAGDGASLHFLTGRRGDILRVADAAGFHFTYDPRQNQFAHASGIMVATPDGRLARYFYGIHYDQRDLRLGLVEASAEKIGSPVDELLLFCYHYDPTTGKYGLAIQNALKIGGGVTVFALVFLLAILIRKDRREKPGPGAAIGSGGRWRPV